MKNQHLVIDDQYRIESDSSSWNLIYEEVIEIKPDGNPKIARNTWYFANIKQCLRTYLDQSLKKSKEISGIIKRIDDAEKNINGFMKTFGN